MSTTNQRRLPQILVVTAVAVEQTAISEGIQLTDYDAIIDIITCGVGPAAAAAVTATAITKTNYDLIISAGIGGGFTIAPIGSIVISDVIVAADLGAEDGENFIPVEQLGFGKNDYEVDTMFANHAGQALQQANIQAIIAPIITVATATGSAKSANRWIQNIPNVAAEAMEGSGVATAAQLANIPVIEIRAISNQVGPRDRSSWRITEALHTLKHTFCALAPLFDIQERRIEK
ncbi:futalosine hydrolase [Paenibacillus yanchengensis]|uniref:Futalosine hydrolase n=1 Tax=Paenibacillus yanchengensis TaxID=2035833 RepID=A0ABW4YPU8_9BACL